ncbi:HK97-gp10 family putative phage morphogenesis protein [Pandoraea soli]
MIEFKMDGLKDLEQDLLRLPDKIGGRVLQSALTSAALPIVKEAQTRVPIAHAAYKLYGGGKADPGWLRQRIIRKKVRQSTNSAEVIVAIKDQRQAYFWRFIEFGTSKLTAHPFMRPAFEAKASEALDRFANKLGDGIDKALTKLNYRR